MVDPVNEVPILFENVFAKSSEKIVTAQKKATTIIFDIYNPPLPIRGMGTIISGTSVQVNKIVALSASLYSKATTPITLLTGKIVTFYHKLDTGSFESLGTATVDTYGYAEMTYTLAKAGEHTFYAEFAGDSEYEGCSKGAKAFAKMRSVR